MLKELIRVIVLAVAIQSCFWNAVAENEESEPGPRVIFVERFVRPVSIVTRKTPTIELRTTANAGQRVHAAGHGTLDVEGVQHMFIFVVLHFDRPMFLLDRSMLNLSLTDPSALTHDEIVRLFARSVSLLCDGGVPSEWSFVPLARAAPSILTHPSLLALLDSLNGVDDAIDDSTQGGIHRLPGARKMVSLLSLDVQRFWDSWRDAPQTTTRQIADVDTKWLDSCRLLFDGTIDKASRSPLTVPLWDEHSVALSGNVSLDTRNLHCANRSESDSLSTDLPELEYLRVIRIVERLTPLDRQQIPSLIDLGGVPIETPSPHGNADSLARFRQMRQMRAGLQGKAGSKSDDGGDGEGQSDWMANYQPDEVQSALAGGFGDELEPAVPLPGALAGVAGAAGGFILKAVIVAALGDAVIQAMEEMGEHIGKVASKIIAKLMCEQDLETGKAMKRRLLSTEEASAQNLVVSEHKMSSVAASLLSVSAMSGTFTESETQALARAYAKTPPIGVAIIKALIPQLTNAVTEAVALSFTEIVSPLLKDAICSSLQGELAAKITSTVQPIITRATYKNTKKTIPLAVERMVPPMLVRPVVHTVTNILTRSLTHTIVPALTFTLSHAPSEHMACSYCHSYQTYCDMCHVTPEEMQSRLYTAEYYASFYSDYYVVQPYE